MDEIRIDIETLEGEKARIQLEIFNLFQYDRWPSDIEFASLKKSSEQLIIIQASIESLKSVLLAIEHNVRVLEGE